MKIASTVTSFIFAFGLCCFSPFTGSASGDLVINLVDSGGSAPTTTGTGTLSYVVQSAADVWELAFNDSSFDHTLNIVYGWDNLDGGTLGVHSLTGQGGDPNRETNALIRFDGDGSSSFFLDGTLNSLDPIGMGNSEYGIYTETSDDYGGGEMNKGRVFTSASGAAAGRTDLFSVALHEIGHALGMSSGNFSYQNETWPDNDVDVGVGFQFAGSELPTTNNGLAGDEGFQSNAHLNINTSLLFPSISSNIRRLPSSADILANAQISQFYNPNLNLVSVPEPGSMLLFGVAMIGIATRRRRSI